MKITKEFIEAWEDAKKYMNLQPNKRKFSDGVQILKKSGYKPNVAKLLTRKGEQDWTREKLFSCLSDVIRLFYNPTAPKFNQPEDVDVLNDEAGEVTTSTQDVDIQEIEQEGPSFRKWPEPIQRLMSVYAKTYRERAQTARERQELPEVNDEQVAAQRKKLSQRMDTCTEMLERFWALRIRYDDRGIEPTDEEIEYILIHTAPNEKPSPSTNDDEEDISKMDTETLRVKRKSCVTERKRKMNLLKYQKPTKQKQENPMPECPKRTILEKKIAKLTERISKYEMELANRE